MNKEKIFKFIFIVLLLSFIAILIAEKSGYYQSKETKSKVLTEEQIKLFEHDLAEGKDVDVENYVKDSETNYSNKLSNDIYKVSLKLEKTIDKTIKFIFNGVSKTIND